jgi:hypothetical protein
VLCAGAGSFEAAHITLTPGIFLGSGERIPDMLAQRLDEAASRAGETVPAAAVEQSDLELRKAGFSGVDLLQEHNHA